MSDAVAKLRFDLLANLAGFDGPMKQAADTADKTAERFNRAFDSSKNSAARAEKEAEAWRAAMHKEGSFLASGMDFGGAESAATKNRVRWAEMLPWGKTARVEISKEAALTAAELGKHNNLIAQKLAEASKGLGGLAGGGFGGLLDSGLGMIKAHPLGAAAAAVGGLATAHIMGRESYVREASRSAREFGASTEDVSALHAAGADDQLLGHLQRAIGEGDNTGLKMLGLDSGKLGTESLKQELLDVADKFNKLPSAVDRARAAHELFGKEGQEMIPVLQALKGKLAEVAESKIVTAKESATVRAGDKDLAAGMKTLDEAKEKALNSAGINTGLGGYFKRAFVQSTDFLFSDDATKKKHERQFQAEDRSIVMADLDARAKEADDRKMAMLEQEIERTKKISELSKAVTQNVNDEIAELANPGAAARNRFERESGGGGKAMQQYDDAQTRLRWAREDKENRDKAEGVRRSLMSPVGQFDQDMIDMEGQRPFMSAGVFARAQRKRGRQAEDQLGIHNPEEDYANRLSDLAMARGRVSADKLHRAAADAADMLLSAVDAPFMTSFEKFNAHMRAIDKGEENSSFTRDEADRRRKAETDSELSHAGVKRPLEEFKDSMEEIARLRERGTIRPDEYAKRERELRRTAISGATSGLEEVHAVGAAAAGSREAYSAQVSAQLNSPIVQLQQETNRKLDAIVKATEAQVARPAPVVAEPAAPW